jgi:hypothetical protein
MRELRSLKDRENALLAERSEVQSLNEEASALRNSIIRLLDEVFFFLTRFTQLFSLSLPVIYL